MQNVSATPSGRNQPAMGLLLLDTHTVLSRTFPLFVGGIVLDPETLPLTLTGVGIPTALVAEIVRSTIKPFEAPATGSTPLLGAKQTDPLGRVE